MDVALTWQTGTSVLTWIDAHHHLWRLSRGDYAWPTPGMPIHRDYDLAHLRPLLGPVTGTVLVQATRASAGLIRGVVGWTDLAAREAASAIRRLARDPLLKGVRPMLQDMPDRAWIMRDAVCPALQVMADADLALDLLIREDQVPLVPQLAAAHPALRLVVDHAAKPAIAAGRFAPWAENMAAAAAATNVACKLSGLATEAGEGWDAARLQPYADHLLACFGPDRLIWGSDWPVLELAGTYAAWIEATERLLATLPASDRSGILGATAMRVYRL